MSDVLSDQLGDETEIEQTARDLRRAAETAHETGVTIERSVNESEWAGPMKDRYLTTSEQHRKELAAEANELLDVATKLDQHAQWIRDEKARLDGLRNRIMAWAQENPAGTSETGQDASLIIEVPPQHNFGWDDLADRLRGNGIVF